MEKPPMRMVEKVRNEFGFVVVVVVWYVLLVLLLKPEYSQKMLDSVEGQKIKE
jgi:hypothetical protein